MEMEKGYFRTDAPPPPYPHSPPNTVAVNALDPSTTQSAIAVSSLISQVDGRASIFTLCPYCVTQVHTKTKYVPNRRVKIAGERELRGTLVKNLCFAVIMVIFISGMTIGFGVMTSRMPVEIEGPRTFLFVGIAIFSVFFFVVNVVLWWKYSNLKNKIANNYHDVTHTCPICHKTLGVCDGFPFYEEDKRDRKFRAAISASHTHH